MKVQIVYSSLSGCTRRLAEGIFAALPVAEAIDGAPRRMETHSPHGAEVRLLTDEQTAARTAEEIVYRA